MLLWLILVQFVFRLTFGVAAAMALTPSRHVTSGFYKVHLWVLMGLNVFVALSLFSFGLPRNQPAAWLAAANVVLSYIGSVIWIYENRSLGMAALVAVCAVAGCGAALTWDWTGQAALVHALDAADILTAGLVLGSTLTAMLLGHWYLNTPTMDLLPLRRLLLLMGIALLARMAVSATGLGFTLATGAAPDARFWIFVSLRCLAGFAGGLVTGLLAWQTLKIPNTQSATGILYAGVILTFIGELTSQLLSASADYPV